MAGIILTRSCNLRCSYCDQVWLNNYRKHFFMMNDIWEASIKFLSTIGDKQEGKVLNFFGGEPLLNPGLFIDFITRSWDKLPPVIRVTTNGTTIDEALCNFLLDHNINVVLSHDGKDQIKNRGRDPLSESNTDWVRKCVNQINYVVADPLNIYENTIYLWENGFTIINDIDLYGPYQFSDNIYQQYEIQYELLLQISCSSLTTSDPLYLVSTIQPSYREGMWNCGWFRNAFTIDVNGDIYPCHRGPELPAEEFSIGNVLDQTNINYSKLVELRSYPSNYCVVRHIQQGRPLIDLPDDHFLRVNQIRKEIKNRYNDEIKMIEEAYRNARS